MERLLAYAPMAHTARGNLVQRRSMERLYSPMCRWRIRLVYWRAYAPMAHTARLCVYGCHVGVLRPGVAEMRVCQRPS